MPNDEIVAKYTPQDTWLIIAPILIDNLIPNEMYVQIFHALKLEEEYMKKQEKKKG